jgi:hypothetical protein
MESDPERLVTALATVQPAYLSRLEAIIGPIQMSFRDEHQENRGYLSRPSPHRPGEIHPAIARLSIRYRWDMYHQDPRRQRDVALEEYTLVMPVDRALVERVLGEQFGAPRQILHTLEGVTFDYAGYHPFYVTGGGDHAMILEWHAEVPRFAIPVPEEGERLHWLGELRRRIESATSVDEIEAFCKAAPEAAGVQPEGTLNTKLNPRAAFKSPTGDGRDYWIRFMPPVRATQLAEVFGWLPAIGVSHDIHMSSWHVERAGDGWLPSSGALQHWQLRAQLAAWPSGPEQPGGGMKVSHAIGADDEVTHLAIQPRYQ